MPRHMSGLAVHRGCRSPADMRRICPGICPGAATRRGGGHAVLRHDDHAGSGRRHDRHQSQRHVGQHHRSALARTAAAGRSLDQRAAAQPGDREPGRAGVRRDARQRERAQCLSLRDRGVRPAPHARQRAVDGRHVGRERRAGHDLQARCARRLHAAAVRQHHPQRPVQQRRGARQHRVRSLEPAVVRVGYGNRHDPSHPCQRRRGSRVLRSRRAGPRQFHRCGEEDAGQPAADSLRPVVAGEDHELSVGPVRIVSRMLEHRGERPPRVGSRCRARLGQRRDQALLLGRQQPGPRRGAELEQPAGRREAQFGVVDPDRSGRRLRYVEHPARIHHAGLLHLAAGCGAGGAEPPGERHQLPAVLRSSDHAGGRARRHPQSRARRGQSVRHAA